MSAAAIETAPDIGEAMRTKLAGFVATLRDNGFAVGLAEARDALMLLASPAARLPSSLKPAFRALFVGRPFRLAEIRRAVRGLLERPAYAPHGIRERRRRGRMQNGRAGCRNAGAPSGSPGAPDEAQLGGGEEGAAEGRGRPGGRFPKRGACLHRHPPRRRSRRDREDACAGSAACEAHARAARPARAAPPRAAGASTSAAPSIAASRMAARRSSFSGGSARRSRSASSSSSTRPAR